MLKHKQAITSAKYINALKTIPCAGIRLDSYGSEILGRKK